MDPLPPSPVICMRPTPVGDRSLQRGFRSQADVRRGPPAPRGEFRLREVPQGNATRPHVPSSPRTRPPPHCPLSPGRSPSACRGCGLALVCVCISVSKGCWLAAVTNRSQACSNRTQHTFSSHSPGGQQGCSESVVASAWPSSVRAPVCGAVI